MPESDQPPASADKDAASGLDGSSETTIDGDRHETGIEESTARENESTTKGKSNVHDAQNPSKTDTVDGGQGETSDGQRRPESIHSQQESQTAASTDIEKGITQPQSTELAQETIDENVVWWDGDDDPQNPYNWPSWLKVMNCVLISAMTFVTPLASSMFAPGVPALMREFRSTSSELGSFCVSVYVLGYATGPMVFAPLSELYGRPRIFHIANVGFIAFVIACAKAPSFNSLIAFRFLSGVFGSCPITNGGGSIADMIVQEKRGAAMASFAIGPLLGPIIGPVVGGVVTDALGWRWVFWIIAIIGSVLAIVLFVFARETYAPVILQAKVDKLKKETGNQNLRSKLDPGLSTKEYFARSIVRPFKLLLFSPICMICNLYVGLAYAYLYLMFTSLTPLFIRIYHFDTIHAGLTFLGLGVGSLLGVAYFSIDSDRYIKKKAAKDGVSNETKPPGQGQGPRIKPEYRLPPLRIGAFLMPAGFFIYGWTAQYKVHWIAPIIGTAIIGVGNLIIFMSLQMYLVDSFTIYAASAIAANTVVRSIAGAVLPLAGIPMYDKLGLGWGNSLLGFIALLLLPAPWLFIKHGEYLRKKYEIKNL